MKKSELKQLIKNIISEQHHLKYDKNPKEIEVGDIIGNNVQGFNFKVLKINGNTFDVENIDTGEKFKTFRGNMYLPGKYNWHINEYKNKPKSNRLVKENEISENSLEYSLQQLLDIVSNLGNTPEEIAKNIRESLEDNMYTEEEVIKKINAAYEILYSIMV